MDRSRGLAAYIRRALLRFHFGNETAMRVSEPFRCMSMTRLMQIFLTDTKQKTLTFLPSNKGNALFERGLLDLLL